jgi:hypothetical protein
MTMLDVSAIAKSITQRQFIWQMKFITADELYKFARDRGLSFWCLDGDIRWLWQIGLLRADFC